MLLSAGRFDPEGFEDLLDDLALARAQVEAAQARLGASWTTSPAAARHLLIKRL